MVKKISNNKGILLPTALKILLGLLCIVILIILLVSLYNITTRKSSLEQASENVAQIAYKMNRLSEGEFDSYTITNPIGWNLFFLDKNSKSFFKCDRKNCICMCPEPVIDKCDVNGACEVVENDLSFDIYPGITYMTNNEIRNLSIVPIKEFFSISFSKKDGKIFIIPENEREFLDILGRKIVYNGKTQAVKDAVLDELNLYFDTKIKTGPNLGKSIIDIYGTNFAGISFSQMEKDGFSSDDLKSIIANESTLDVLIKKQLNAICSEYYFRIPQGMIKKDNSLIERKNPDEIIFSSFGTDSVHTFPLVYNMTYKGITLNIMYSKKVECK